MGFFDWIKNAAQTVWNGAGNVIGKVGGFLRDGIGKVSQGLGWIGDRINDVRNLPVVGGVIGNLIDSTPIGRGLQLANSVMNPSSPPSYEQAVNNPLTNIGRMGPGTMPPSYRDATRS